MKQSERIYQARELLGITQSEIAFHMGISQGAYSLYEKNRDVPSKYYDMLAKMGINVHWLITGEGEPINQEAHLLFKKMRENSEVSVVDVRVSPNVVLPFLQFNFRQSFSRGEKIRKKAIIVRDDDVDYSGAIVVESGDERMSPTVIPGEKLLCLPVGDGDISYITGVVLVVVGSVVSIKRIKSNGIGEDFITLLSDNSDESVSIRKSDILYMYKVVASVYRPIS